MLNRISKVLGEGIDVQTLISAEPTCLTPDSFYLSVTEEITGKPAILVRKMVEVMLVMLDVLTSP
ncbi:MAG: succinyl-diaminopimelate desuccinylase [Candidatus Scalindua rubra]|uniref:Succinyl-diaminopimelate desuccinylase n=1 Tax=Candidatus Scalindua rubra TaxID=1872076 RepID=A0A1E3X445_9BACT|nr:MAG: succinyl-diaminopimelate desuccinylase [Candidatus Scalindua rubra]